jgi:hypothetical protein
LRSLPARCDCPQPALPRPQARAAAATAPLPASRACGQQARTSQRLQPTQSSVRGAEAIWPARQPSQGTISSTSVGQARTHCVQPMQVS